MASRKKRSRVPGHRREKPTVLIVCEGQTEFYYFKNIKNKFRASWMQPELSDRTDPMGVIKNAEAHQKKLKLEGLEVEAWVVFDAERRDMESSRRYRDAIISAESKGLKVANSSPCFEYWALIHYEPGIIVINPKEAKRELGKNGRVPGYEEPNLPFEDLWRKYQSGAPSKAAKEKRNAHSSIGDDPRFARPVTYVDVLVDNLSAINGNA